MSIRTSCQTDSAMSVPGPGIAESVWHEVRVDITDYAALPGAYELEFQPTETEGRVETRKPRLEVAGVTSEGSVTNGGRGDSGGEDGNGEDNSGGSWIVKRPGVDDSRSELVVFVCEVRVTAGQRWMARIRPL